MMTHNLSIVAFSKEEVLSAVHKALFKKQWHSRALLVGVETVQPHWGVAWHQPLQLTLACTIALQLYLTCSTANSHVHQSL